MLWFSRIISYVLHPIFAPLISIYLLLQLPTYINYQLNEPLVKFIYAVVILNLVICPILFSLFLKRKGVIKSLEMKQVEERIYPYLSATIFYIITIYLFKQINFPLVYLKFLFAALMVIIALFTFALFGRKASAHLAAIGGICGMLFLLPRFFAIDTTFLFILFVLIAGLLASARLNLKAHTLSEVSMGFLVGFGMQYLVLV